MAQTQKRVLVVDGDENGRRLLVSLFRNRGLIVDEAVDGEDGLGQLRRNEYAVVLFDPLMTVAGGVAVLDAIKRDGLVTGAVMLVVTEADQKFLDGLDSERIHGIVRKPFDPHELVALVTACVEVKGRGTLETMALAVISGAPLLDWLQQLN
jgi:two-component system OmpR family response regulator